MVGVAGGVGAGAGVRRLSQSQAACKDVLPVGSDSLSSELGCRVPGTVQQTA